MILKKTITRLTKNWADDFLIHNLEHFVIPEYKYFSNIEEIKMSIDMTIFEEIAEKTGETVEHLIFKLCENYTYGRGKVILSEYAYKHIEQEGGGEGGGEYCYGIFQLNGVFYKAEYSYYSCDGYNYDDIISTLKIVQPKEKMITVYE